MEQSAWVQVPLSSLILFAISFFWRWVLAGEKLLLGGLRSPFLLWPSQLLFALIKHSGYVIVLLGI
ncbi:hypothetical protein F5X96DRAFT_621850 [Biscogniauxia mediterranea]|nr:hypothetical protein F5X96DRAFT_621850 [Biscogniauxia mediterranea]